MFYVVAAKHEGHTIPQVGSRFVLVMWGYTASWRNHFKLVSYLIHMADQLGAWQTAKTLGAWQTAKDISMKRVFEHIRAFKRKLQGTPTSRSNLAAADLGRSSTHCINRPVRSCETPSQVQSLPYPHYREGQCW